MSEPIIIVAHITQLNCPHCSYELSGFVNDPRGGTFNCDSCKLDFEVPENAEIDFG